jgi:hypothetical protein
MARVPSCAREFRAERGRMARMREKIKPCDRSWLKMLKNVKFFELVPRFADFYLGLISKSCSKNLKKAQKTSKTLQNVMVLDLAFVRSQWLFRRRSFTFFTLFLFHRLLCITFRK